jgi:hypothetical protein
MPLTVNVGLSRKASKDYQSTGTSINLTAELDATLLARPQELQQEIEKLYQQADLALGRQTAPAPAGNRPGVNGHATARAVNGHGSSGRRANGAATGSNTAASPRASSMTASQRRAITSIAQRLGVDAEAEVRDVFGWNLAELSIKQASTLIDHLRTLQQGVRP